MSDNGNAWGDEMAEVLRAADEAAVSALRAHLDVEGRLTEVMAHVEGERAFAADARAVLASWPLELTPAAVRAHRVERRIIRSVDDEDFFAAAIGRPRVGLDPWPDVMLTISQDQAELRVVLSLPSRPPHGTGLVIVAYHGSWTAECDFKQADESLIDESLTDEFWPVNFTARLVLPANGADVAADLTVDLQVVRTGE